MKRLLTTSFLIIFLTISCLLNAQELTQIVRGKIIDSESQAALPFVSVSITTTDPIIGAISDDKGYFRLENVPIGRHNLQISCIGYETQWLPELMVSTGKEVILTIKLKESVSSLGEVEIKAYKQKDKPLNSMASVSARTISMEEARRYAGGYDDPGRLAASFAGVTSDFTRDNTIIIRGNSPKGLLWRLEGVEIPNPNHFADMSTFGGGGISALSALVIGNSDFFTSAFPAEYGNATSGVFDIRMRSGNNEKHEHAIQLGTMGIDISSEGPLGSNTQASYLFNYRYSTMGLIKHVFPEEIKDFIPTYQDLSFKLNMPTNKAGVFSVWGLGASDGSATKALEDSSEWEMNEHRMDGMFAQKIGAAGLNHKYIFKKNAYLNTSLAYSGTQWKYTGDIYGFDMKKYESEYLDNQNFKYTFTTVYNHKFSPKHANRSGIIVDNIHYHTLIRHAPVYDMGMMEVANGKYVSSLMQFFTQSKYSFSKRFSTNVGIHGNYFDLNEELTIEPRAGITYKLTHAQALSLGYGMHSRLEPLTLYYAKVFDGTKFTQPNKDLRLSKSHHFVVAYDFSIKPNLRIKIEPYVQYLYDVPVIPDSNFSVLNMDADWYFADELINTGTGTNMGLDITLERFLDNGFYYLLTASIFDSKFVGDDGIERSTRYNNQYVFNLLYGKEWVVGKEKNKILGLNFRMNYFGGKKETPVDQKASKLVEDVVYQYDKLYTDKEPNKMQINLTINYRVNKKNHSKILGIQMTNLLLTKENYGMYWNYNTRQVERWEFAVPVPNISYKIEF